MSKARTSASRKERAARIQKDIAPFIGKECVKIEVINAAIHHYRVTGPAGGQIDYYASTARWCVHRDSVVRGQGLREAMLLLATLEAPPAYEGPKHGKLVTVFADGSYDLAKGVGGWGCWIKTHGHDAIMKGGPLTSAVTGSADAEARALANGVRMAVLRKVADHGDTIMLQSDCQVILAALMRLMPSVTHSKAPSSTVDVKPAKRLTVSIRKSEGLASLISVLTTYRFKVIVRHVKGHQGEHANPRAWVNTQTDRLARKGLADARRAHGERKIA